MRGARRRAAGRAQCRRRINPPPSRQTRPMLTLFLRAVLLYLLVFTILRLTGKRQVADLQPFDLLITLLIADLASCAIADTSIPLVYSIVPIIALYLVQQGLTFICLKSGRLRRVVCGSPVILVSDGVVNEAAMGAVSYTVIDLLDQLRSKGVFDLTSVAYAILETNGSMSVLEKGAYQSPTIRDLQLPETKAALSYMLILDGRLCRDAMRTLDIDESWICHRLSDFGIRGVMDVLYLHLSPDGTLSVQTKARTGAAVKSMQTGRRKNV